MESQFKKTVETLYQKISAYFIANLVLTATLIVIFYSLSEGVIYNELTHFDQVIGDFIRGYANSSLTNTAIFITRLGSGKIEIALCILFAGIFYFVFKEKWYSLLLIFSLLSGWLLNVLLKLSFHRERPTIDHLVDVGGYSFPSGHAMVSTIFYGMLGYTLWRIVKNKRRSSWYVVLLTIFLILAIGTSRVYLGVHYPSDVIAGFSFGGLWLLASIWFLRFVLSPKNESSLSLPHQNNKHYTN